MNEKIQEFIYSHKDEIVKDLAELVAIPSVLDEPERGAPFGAETKRALLKAEEYCQKMGFVTSVIGDAVLCADYGENPEFWHTSMLFPRWRTTGTPIRSRSPRRTVRCLGAALSTTRVPRWRRCGL